MVSLVGFKVYLQGQDLVGVNYLLVKCLCQRGVGCPGLFLACLMVWAFKGLWLTVVQGLR